MTDNILSTIVLHYTDGSTASSSDCKVELDEVLNSYVDTDGKTKVKTSFAPGDLVYFLAKPAKNVRIVDVKATAGDISSFGDVNRDRLTDALFVELNSVDSKPSISYVPSGNLRIEWVGNVGGTVQLDLDDLSLDISSGEIPCSCNITIPVSFKSYLLTPQVLDFDSYTIYVVIYLEKIS